MMDDVRFFVEKMNLIDDILFQKVMADKEVAQEVLRIILNKPQLKVKECRTNESLRNAGTKSVVLDLLCEEEDGTLINVEMQKANDDDHLKRVRYYASNLDTAATEKGKHYRDLPDLYMVYITDFDLFRKGRTIYELQQVIKDDGSPVDDGVHKYFVNTKVKDGSSIAKLMSYFAESNKENESTDFPATVERVKYFKEVKEGVSAMMSESMKELTQSIRQEGWEAGIAEGEAKGKAEGKAEGIIDGKLQSAKNMLADGIPLEKVMKYTGLSREEIESIL